MKLSLKKFILLMLSTIITIIISGCSNIETGTDITLNRDGSTITTVRLSYDSSLNDIVGNGLLSTLLKDKEFEVSKQIESKRVIEEASITTEKLSFSEIAALIAKNSITKNNIIENEYINATIINKPGFFKNDYNVNVELKKDVFNEISLAVDKDISILGENNLSNYIGGNIKNSIGMIPYTLKISFPINISDSNSISQLDNNTLLWNYNLKDLTIGTSINFSFTAPNFITISIGIIIILIVLIIVIIKSFNKKK